jgi:dipeptidyl aminopeptidase/acylaminoacyl peptidase
VPRAALWPAVNLGFLYTRLRYHVDLRRASPLDAVHATTAPILLIHGTADANIPFRHSEILHAANPSATKLWAVPGAGHVAAISTNPDLYAKTVIAWFATH